MPPALLFDPSLIDPSTILVARESIYEVLPHRYEFEQLHGIHYIDSERRLAAGFRDVTSDEFWVKGHIPDRPILPGVLMIESAAQLASYATHVLVARQQGFLGLGGVDKVKFRGVVSPDCRMMLLAKLLSARSRKLVWACQALVDGRLVFEGEITGIQL